MLDTGAYTLREVSLGAIAIYVGIGGEEGALREAITGREWPPWELLVTKSAAGELPPCI